MRDYICFECGSVMDMADEQVLVCPKCYYSIEIADYDDELAERELNEEFYVGPIDYENHDYWRFDMNFPEEFPGESYEEVYEEE